MLTRGVLSNNAASFRLSSVFDADSDSHKISFLIVKLPILQFNKLNLYQKKTKYKVEPLHKILKRNRGKKMLLSILTPVWLGLWVFALTEPSEKGIELSMERPHKIFLGDLKFRVPPINSNNFIF